MDRGNYRRGGDSGGKGGGNRGRGQGEGRRRGGGGGEPQFGGGRGGPQIGGGRGGPPSQPPQQWGNQPRASGQGRGVPYNQPGQNPGRGGGNAWARPPPQQPQPQGSGGGGTGWARPPQLLGSGGVGNAWVRAPPQQHGGGTGGASGGNQQQQVVDRPPPQSSDPVQIDLGSLSITIQTPSSPPKSDKEKRVPVTRPDTGKIAVRPIRLLANHFPVRFNPQTTIMHYDVDIKVLADENRPVKKSINKSDLRMIREKLSADNPAQFPIDKTAYDGEKNIFSAVQLPTGSYTVNCSDGDDAKGRSYVFTIKLVAELKLCKLKEYLSGNLSYIPRDILQGMELVMKENPSRCRVSVGRCFYSNNHLPEHDFGFGVAAYRGFQQSLKTTSGGLALCLDYSVLALRKPMPVLDFLRDYIGEFNENNFRNKRRAANDALVGLKVRVIHRRSSQKFLIKELTPRNTRDLTFPLEDPEGKDPPRDVFLVDYFRDKYQREIRYKDLPSLDIGKGGRKNYVPMEFCVLVEGQRYPKEHLDRDTALFLKNISLARPLERKDSICEMVRAEDGPCGAVTRNFEIGVDTNMTRVSGRILPPPDLKLGGQSRLPVNDKCQWNLVGKSVVDGKALQRWALIDFSSQERNPNFRLRVDEFIYRLRDRCRKLGIIMEEPVVKHFSGMHELSVVGKVEDRLKLVVDEAGRKVKGRLQMIVCVMAAKHNGYKYLKWVSETKIGVVTQCCLSSNVNKGQDQYLANLCMKINAKLGGSNMELMERLPNFGGEDNVMFIGADVNHPAARNVTCPSIAAVVATVNWPAANRYAARVCPQNHRTEKIQNFGSMCVDLLNAYARLNSVKPNKIVVFRDGVSEGQFDMVLNEELIDLAKAIYDDHYRPTITLVVAQKRHHTRLFPESGPANVPPGTVVDTVIVHPSDFDFYLCSHFGGLGTSKPTHYHVLWDENGFNSDRLQKLIYNMCFTFARCTKPVSLVPPVYYADLVAYRGRMFQEVLMEISPGSTTSSYAASSSSSSSNASFEQRFYDLHPELQNIMFFV